MNRLLSKVLSLLAVVFAGQILLLSGCSAYDPSYDNTVVRPTTTPKVLSTAVTTPEGTVVIRGNVYVRDNSGAVQGWLEAGTVVNAVCDGQWCVVKSGQFTGLRFWRGCSADNPDNTGCTADK
jgi:hypothetical protein